MTDDIEVIASRTGSAWKRTRDRFIAAQNGKCAICMGLLVSPRLDHCHDSGFIRGALCNSCNVKLGWYEKRRHAIEAYLSNAGEFQAYRTPITARKSQ